MSANDSDSESTTCGCLQEEEEEEENKYEKQLALQNLKNFQSIQLLHQKFEECDEIGCLATLKDLNEKWCKIDQPQLTKILDRSVEDTAYNFLRSLSVQITPKKASLLLSPESGQNLRSRSIQYGLGLAMKFGKFNFRSNFFDDTAPSRGKPKTFGSRADKAFAEFHWSSAVALVDFEDDSPQRTVEQLQLILAFSKMDPQRKEFLTVMGRVILQAAGRRLRARNICLLGIDILSLILLVALAERIRRRQIPHLLILVCLALLSIFKLFDQCAEIIMCLKSFGFEVIRVYIRGWTSLLALAEVYTSIVMITMLICYRDSHSFEHSWFDLHPVLLMFVVIIRWIQFLLSLLVSKYFGSTILPAFEAAISKESLRFLTFLLLILCASAHGYWSLPFGGQRYFWEILIRMFRMEYVGDFDMQELEGVHDHMNLTTGEINNGDGTEWHDGVRVMFIGCSMMTTIIAMNVYIGVVSKTYDALKQNSQRLVHHFRAQMTLRQLLRWKIWRAACNLDPIGLFVWLIAGYGQLLCEGKSADLTKQDEGMWIVAPL